MNLAWIPNSITMGNLLFGFLSIIFASKGDYQFAGLAILFAVLLDGLDGQVARILKVSSPLGAELDSLADCVTFGVAPGYIAYAGFLPHLPLDILGRAVEMNIFIAAVYPMCAAYRLARFNVDHSQTSFSGLPSPIARVIVALVAIAFPNLDDLKYYSVILIPAYVITGLLMVSTVKFSKPQVFILNKIHGIQLLILLLIIIALGIVVRKYILLILIGLIALYIVAGLIMMIIQFIQDNKY